MQILLHPALALLFAPLLPGVINRVKAAFAGRKGPPLLQLYFDLCKLFRKGAVYSETTTWVFRAGPLIGFAVSVIALAFLPLGGQAPLLHFRGDLVVLIYLFGTARFFTVIAAMDTGSPFEGMGASREMQFSALAEPALFFCLATLARLTGSWSLNEILGAITPQLWQAHAPVLALVLAGMLIVYLAENCRIPVDDPTTHLELTMVHEVMVLDHGGIELAFIEYSAALKLWSLGVLIAGLALPEHTTSFWLDTGAVCLGLLLLAGFVGIVESTTARLRLLQVPQLLFGACVLSIFGLLIV